MSLPSEWLSRIDHYITSTTIMSINYLNARKQVLFAREIKRCDFARTFSTSEKMDSNRWWQQR